MGEYITKYRNGNAARSESNSRLNQKRISKSIDIPTRTINRWSNLTDDNYHSEVRRDIAKHFAKSDESFKQLADEFAAIVKEHNRVGYLSSELSDRRDRAEEEMMRRIRDEYGEETYRKVLRGL